MAKEKDTYSLISVDVAPEEEVVRVDAHGVHRDISSDPQEVASQLGGRRQRSDLKGFLRRTLLILMSPSCLMKL